jgi:hypothetical protein
MMIKKDRNENLISSSKSINIMPPSLLFKTRSETSPNMKVLIISLSFYKNYKVNSNDSIFKGFWFQPKLQHLRGENFRHFSREQCMLCCLSYYFNILEDYYVLRIEPNNNSCLRLAFRNFFFSTKMSLTFKSGLHLLLKKQIETTFSDLQEIKRHFQRKTTFFITVIMMCW